MSQSEQRAERSVSSTRSNVQHKMTTLNLITLSLAMLGAQIAWTVELSYGTPFLLELGITEQLTPLVWLAAPIAGLVVQPLIGAISDSSPSKYRRRFWIILSTGVLTLSTFTLAFCQELSAFFVDLFQVGYGDWDATRTRYVHNMSISFAVISFWFLDFALNGLQASLRNLLLDVTPMKQVSEGNAWHGRMTNAGNIIGYGFGFIRLAQLPVVSWIGGSQFRKFCIICIAFLVSTVAVTCYFHEEQERPELKGIKRSPMKEMVMNIYYSALRLPVSIQRVCITQLFAFMGWFPFLFYATTYIGQVMAAQIGHEPDPEYATRRGDLALLLNSLISTAAGFILPILANRNKHLLAHEDDINDEAEHARLKNTVTQWRIEASLKGKRVRLPFMPILLRDIWAATLLFFTLLTLTTFFIHDVVGASAFISLVGISWGVALWAPFALIMEFLKSPTSPGGSVQGHTNRPTHTLHTTSDEHTPLLEEESDTESEELAGGTILGIHNIAIVLPEFLVSLMASIIFEAVDGAANSDPSSGPSSYYGHNGVVWVLRLGGLCTAFGAIAARKIPATPPELEMRRRLEEMRYLKQLEEDLYM